MAGPFSESASSISPGPRRKSFDVVRIVIKGSKVKPLSKLERQQKGFLP